MSKITRTDEQEKVVSFKGDNLLVKAFAGCGKTSTLVELANEKNQPSLMLTFNKSLADEARGKFPPHVECRTTHSLAYGVFGASLQHKLKRPQGAYRNVAGTGSEIAKFFKTGDFIYMLTGERETRKLKAGGVGVGIKETVARFEQSADESIGYQHVSCTPCDAILLRDKNAMRKYKYMVLEYAQKLWDLRTDLRSPVLATHDTYLKLYQLSKPDLSKYEVLYLDELQDTTPCVLDIFLNQEGKCKLVGVGDEFQNIYCQPAGTKVRVVNGEYRSELGLVYNEVNIEDLSLGDNVLSYGISQGHLYKNGKPITKFGERKFTGNLITVNVEGNQSKYTDDHHVIVRLGDSNDGKYVTYVMKKGNQFRVGISPWRYASGQFGAAQRAGQEKADSLWVLSVHDTYREALTHECIISYKYGVPQTVFSPKHTNETQLDCEIFWKEFGENVTEGHALLKAYGKLPENPLWGDIKVGKMIATKVRSSFVTSACNLVDGMHLCVMSNDDVIGSKSHGRIGLEFWKPVKVSSEQVDNLSVYSLEVGDSHTYFADNILTHNCFRGAVNGMLDLDWPQATLSKSFRWGQQVGDMANVILARDGVIHTDVKGFEKLSTQVMSTFDLPSSFYDNEYTMLFRTNGALIQEAVRLLADNKRVNLEIDVSDFTKLLESAIELFGDNMSKVKHEKLVQFENWSEFKTEADAVQGELIRVCKMVESGAVYRILQVLRTHKNVPNPEMTLTTAHKSKGREWDYVILADDFPSCFDKDGKWVGLQDGERNLLYVAATRVKVMLGYNQTVNDLIERASAITQYEHEINNDLDIDDLFDETMGKQVHQLDRELKHCLED